jgi:hypothetical protein
MPFRAGTTAERDMHGSTAAWQHFKCGRSAVQFEGIVTETWFESALWMLLESTAVT